ncbi:MAG TPA: hypothetical protein VF778_09245, partial [Xanthobacteraceae bacterium]
MPRFRSLAGAGLSAALLAACGGGSALSPSAPALPDAPYPLTSARTYGFTGREQRFIVPAGVTQVVIMASGASGATCSGTPSCVGFAGSGSGGLVKAAIAVTAGETLRVYVGGQNGFNGGGAAGKGGKCQFYCGLAPRGDATPQCGECGGGSGVAGGPGALYQGGIAGVGGGGPGGGGGGGWYGGGGGGSGAWSYYGPS